MSQKAHPCAPNTVGQKAYPFKKKPPSRYKQHRSRFSATFSSAVAASKCTSSNRIQLFPDVAYVRELKLHESD